MCGQFRSVRAILTASLLVLALVAASAGCSLLDEPVPDATPRSSSDPRPTPTSVLRLGPNQTARVTRADLLAQLKVRGRLVAGNEVTLAFRRDGLLKTVSVKPGDHVEKGQVIAELDDTALASEIESAKIELEAAKSDLALANLAVTVDGTDLADLAVKSAEADLEVARMGLAKVRAGASEQELRAADLNLQRTKITLWGMQASRDGICGNTSAPKSACDNANAGVAAEELAVTQATEDLNRLKAGPKPDEVALAQAQVVTAERGVQAARDKYNHEVQSVKALAAQQQVNVGLKESRVGQRESDLKRAQDRAQEYKLTAPFSGNVTSLQGQAGDRVTAFQVFGIMVNPTEIHIEAGVASSDIGWVSSGQEAEFTVDGFPSTKYRAKVSTMPTQASTGTGELVYQVRLGLTNTSEAPSTVPAACDVFFTVKRPGVLLVPSSAVLRLEDRAYVDVPVEGGMRRTPVVLGLASGSDVEVLSGLAERDEVLARPMSTRQMSTRQMSTR